MVEGWVKMHGMINLKSSCGLFISLSDGDISRSPQLNHFY